MVFRDLQEEYERLKSIRDQSGVASEDSSDASTGGQQNRDSELLAEAKLLRQHKGRLEARMQVLEDHNRQLEAQLQRLRQLLDQVHLFLTEVMWNVLFYSLHRSCFLSMARNHFYKKYGKLWLAPRCHVNIY